jgi:hypothetical protein
LRDEFKKYISTLLLSSCNFYKKNWDLNLSIQPTFDSPAPIPAQKVFPQCLCRTEPIKLDAHH